MLMIIIGNTGTGKSTLAKRIADLFPTEDRPYVLSAGRWIREHQNEWGHGPEISQKLSQASTEILQKDPTFCLRWLRSQTETCRPVIIEGLRNPVDFAGLYTPGEDIVVRINGGTPHSEFERIGLTAINSYLDFLQAMKMDSPVDVDLFDDTAPATCAQLLTDRGF